jgi:hypothetical protein
LIVTFIFALFRNGARAEGQGEQRKAEEKEDAGIRGRVDAGKK